MATTLRDVVTIRGRFHRSVNLVVDWGYPSSLAEYIPTGTAETLAGFVVSELVRPRGTRAWSITGPYGSGKSAFALFLADLLAHPNPTHRAGKALRKRYHLGASAYLPVLVSAERGPLVPLLVRAFDDAVAPKTSRAPRRVLGSPSAAEMVSHAGRRARRLRRSGVVLFIDELGKFLEYAALHPRDSDVFVLQQLAEAAARSEVPFLVVTILHSGFADYVPAHEETRRSEWQKVQGRFRDVPFQLPPEQVLELIGGAIAASPPPSVSRAWEEELRRHRGAIALREVGRHGVLKRLDACLPLHPITALLLWPLFRSKGAQNERSLFAFLASHEPLGFQDFLAGTPLDTGADHLFRLPRLYDYIGAALGLGVFRGDQARKWSLIDSALARLPGSAPPACASVVKAIGLIGIYGQQIGLAASEDTLQLALGEHADVRRACAFLSQQSLVVYRRHLGAYALWEGSDFDVEAARADAHDRAERRGSLAERLSQIGDPKPQIPRAHYIRTGTFRLFHPMLVDGAPEAIRVAIDTLTTGDGKILFVLPSEDQRDQAIQIARELTAHKSSGGPTVVGIPRDIEGLDLEMREFEEWQWVSQHRLELQGDLVAKQEVRARLVQARERVLTRVGPLIGLPGNPFSPSRSTWVYAGKVREIRSPVVFQRWISDLCERAFSDAPRFRNELLNRTNLSSAASAARRTLIERMLTAAHERRLGIVGNPPEASMYETMLAAGGMHRKARGVWQFRRPGGDWAKPWDLIAGFVASARTDRRPLVELLDRLKSHPIGMREGPIPVLLCAFLLAQRENVALYEEGVFVPELRIEVFERLMRRPETFEIKSHEMSLTQRQALRALAAAAGEWGSFEQHSSTPGLVSVVRALVVFVNSLAPYAKQTRRLADMSAAAVRDLLLRATDPTRLLFEDLPKACGLETLNKGTVPIFVERMTACLSSLARVYPALLDEVETQIRTVLGLSTEAAAAARQLQQRAELVLSYVAEPTLQVFVHEAVRDPRSRDWREGIARAVNGGLPPTHWKDAEAAAFQVRLRQIANDFLRLEELAAEQRRTGAPRVLRFGLLDGSRAELRAIIPIRDEDDAEIDSLVSRILDAVNPDRESSTDFRRTQLEAIGRAAARLLAQDESEEAVK